jgi:hypothetical protein
VLNNLREVILDKKGRHDRGINFIMAPEQVNYFSYGEVYEKAMESYALR